MCAAIAAVRRRLPIRRRERIQPERRRRADAGALNEGMKDADESGSEIIRRAMRRLKDAQRGTYRPDSREIDLAIVELEFRESGHGLYAKPAAHTIRGPYAGVRKGASPAAQRNGVYSKHSFCV